MGALLVEDFRELYEKHVGSVASGDMKAALADMVQENIPAVFDGVRVPRSAVTSYEIKDVRLDGDRWIGEAVYVVADAPAIGLRSIWQQHDGEWKAVALANFDVTGNARGE